jgi:hypothetical protein
MSFTGTVNNLSHIRMLPRCHVIHESIFGLARAEVNHCGGFIKIITHEEYCPKAPNFPREKRRYPRLHVNIPIYLSEYL